MMNLVGCIDDQSDMLRLSQNRELQIMKQLRHTNVCELKNCFYSKGDKVIRF